MDIKKIIPWIILVILITAITIINIKEPELFSDKNNFFINFVNHELLATLGFIMAIILSSAASMQLEINKIEDETGIKFDRTRSSIKKSKDTLILIFAISFITVIIKPHFSNNEILVRIINSFSIISIYIYTITMNDIIDAFLKVPSKTKIKNELKINNKEKIYKNTVQKSSRYHRSTRQRRPRNQKINL